VIASLLAGCGGGSKHTTSPTTTTTVITRTTTRPPVTATAVHVYSPSVKVGAHTSGRCVAQSGLVVRANVWRCMVGSQVRDPCFVRGARAVVCPLGGPWGSSALLISLPGPLPRVAARRPGLVLPWAIELGDGSRCVRLSGAGRVSYACDTEEELFGMPDRRLRVWTIPAAGGSRPAVRPNAIRVAWF
jgi:hypothetical protein